MDTLTDEQFEVLNTKGERNMSNSELLRFQIYIGERSGILNTPFNLNNRALDHILGWMDITNDIDKKISGIICFILGYNYGVNND